MAAALGVGAFGFCANGFEPTRVAMGGGTIEIEIGPGDFDGGRQAQVPAQFQIQTQFKDLLIKWVSDAARAVTVYYGRFPVPLVRVEVRLAQEAGVTGGVTYGETPPRTRIAVGVNTKAAELTDDWTMTHELTHLAFPNMTRRHTWIEEGIATYVEPVARVQAGGLRAERIWADMVRDMPKGMPNAGGPGLDDNRTWAATYWGGALFCLLADIRFRERTNNRRGLQDALRGILNAGGNIGADWPIERAFQTGDEAVGVPVLAELYESMGKASGRGTPFQVDLPALWNRLGVAAAGRGVVFRDDASLPEFVSPLRRGGTDQARRESESSKAGSSSGRTVLRSMRILLFSQRATMGGLWARSFLSSSGSPFSRTTSHVASRMSGVEPPPTTDSPGSTVAPGICAARRSARCRMASGVMRIMRMAGMSSSWPRTIFRSVDSRAR